MFNKKCSECGKNFIAQTEQKKFCSECVKKHKQTVMKNYYLKSHICITKEIKK